MKDNFQVLDSTAASLSASGRAADDLIFAGRYRVECFAPDGTLKWSDEYDNLVVTQGRTDALERWLRGSSYTAAWYFGLISSAGYSAIAAGDTAASHSGWTEFTGYSESNRPTAAFSAASAGSISTSAVAEFTINASGTVKGSFLISNNTKGGTTGTLASAGLFSSPGDRTVASGDLIRASYTMNTSAS
jgi:hypothetical protein